MGFGSGGQLAEIGVIQKFPGGFRAKHDFERIAQVSPTVGKCRVDDFHHRGGEHAEQQEYENNPDDNTEYGKHRSDEKRREKVDGEQGNLGR